MAEQKIRKPEDMKYRIVMFKIKGHETWRVTQESSFKDVKNVTESKVIEVDRITGKVVLKTKHAAEAVN